MEHPVGTVNCGYVHAGFVSRALLKIRKIPSSIALTNSAIEARGYCKSFLPLWRCTISAPSVECASFTVHSCEERVTRNLMGGSALDVESGSYWLKNGVLVLFMEHSFHGGTVNLLQLALLMTYYRLQMYSLLSAHLLFHFVKICVSHSCLFWKRHSSTSSYCSGYYFDYLQHYPVIKMKYHDSVFWYDFV